MASIEIHQEKARDPESLIALCPFGAIEYADGRLSINAGCRMCRICVRKGEGVFEFVEDNRPSVDKSLWRGIAVYAEVTEGKIHPVSLELIGKAREPARELLEYGVDEVFAYDDPALRYFRIEPYAAVLSDFIETVRPSSILVGGTTSGRSLAPRVAARFRTGLTADCTRLEISPNSDLDQIRPAYGGNIMAHINTPRHRPQFATVRYKIFSIPERENRGGKVTFRRLDPGKLLSAIDILELREKPRETGIEEAEVLVAAGRGVKKPEDLAMLSELAGLLGGRLASTRALVEAGWLDSKHQIGLSGRTVKPKLLIACGVSGAIQFVAGMNGAERIVAINTDPDAPIFKVAHIAICQDLYQVVPQLLERIRSRKREEV